MLHVQAQPKSKLKDPATFKVMGQSVPRVDIPAKVTGGAAYVQDLRLPGMVHARVVRPPSYGAQLTRMRHRGGREAARRRQGRARRQLPRRRRGEGIPGDQGDERACRRREVEGDREACRSRMICSKVLTSLPSQDTTIFERSNPAVAGAEDASRRPIPGRIRRTARSDRPAPSRNSSTAR